MSKPLSKWQVASKGLSLLDMSLREMRMMSFLIENGTDMKWKNAAPNFDEVLAYYMTWNRRSVNYAVRALVKCGWLEEYIDQRGNRVIAVSDDYIKDAKRALKHKDVRTAFGVSGWIMAHQPLPGDVDAIIARAEMMEEGTLIQRVKRVNAELFDALENLRGPSTIGKLIKSLPPINNVYSMEAYPTIGQKSSPGPWNESFSDVEQTVPPQGTNRSKRNAVTRDDAAP